MLFCLLWKYLVERGMYVNEVDGYLEVTSQNIPTLLFSHVIFRNIPVAFKFDN